MSCYHLRTELAYFSRQLPQNISTLNLLRRSQRSFNFGHDNARKSVDDAESWWTGPILRCFSTEAASIMRARCFHANNAKPFYPRLMFKRFVTLIHVTDEASESFWKMHAQFLWQEMYRICKTNPLRICH
jgi:hypothetical protein